MRLIFLYLRHLPTFISSLLLLLFFVYLIGINFHESIKKSH